MTDSALITLHTSRDFSRAFLKAAAVVPTATTCHPLRRRLHSATVSSSSSRPSLWDDIFSIIMFVRNRAHQALHSFDMILFISVRDNVTARTHPLHILIPVYSSGGSSEDVPETSAAGMDSPLIQKRESELMHRREHSQGFYF